MGTTKRNNLLSGYRVMNRDIVKNLILVSTDFSIETELTIKALENNYNIKEIPIAYRSRPVGSYSKLKSFSDGGYILQTILEIFRDYRPMQFFLLLSMISFAIGTGFSWIVLKEFMLTGKITHAFSFALTLFFFFICVVLFCFGFVASSVRNAKQEILRVLKKD